MPEDARDWFEWMLAERAGIERDRERLDGMREAASLTGARIGSVGGGGGDSTDLLDAIAHADDALDRRAARLGMATAQALVWLYARDGLAGEAPTDADCICGFYLEARTWPEVAAELSAVGREPDARWCRYRATRGFAWLDRHGFTIHVLNG